MSKKIVICGFPRSGSSLLYMLMVNSLKDFRYLDKEISCKRFAIDFKNTNIITKRPLDTFKLKYYIKNKYKIIFLLRNPVYVICSRHPSVKDDFFINFNYCTFIRKTISQRKFINLKIFIKLYLKYKSNFLEIRHEDLVNKPDKVQSKIFRYINEKPKIKFSYILLNLSKFQKVLSPIMRKNIKLKVNDEIYKFTTYIFLNFFKNYEAFFYMVKLKYTRFNFWIIKLFFKYLIKKFC